jgi:hypothetical protein
VIVLNKFNLKSCDLGKVAGIEALIKKTSGVAPIADADEPAKIMPSSSTKRQMGSATIIMQLRLMSSGPTMSSRGAAAFAAFALDSSPPLPLRIATLWTRCSCVLGRVGLDVASVSTSMSLSTRGA